MSFRVLFCDFFHLSIHAIVAIIKYLLVFDKALNETFYAYFSGLNSLF